MSSLTKMIGLVGLQKKTQCMRYLSYLKPNKISVESANKLAHEKIQLFSPGSVPVIDGSEYSSMFKELSQQYKKSLLQ